MELWIRSQNKELLIKENKIWYEKRAFCEIITSDGMDDFVIGRYATKERCIEILDLIQKFIVNEYGNIFIMPEK